MHFFSRLFQQLQYQSETDELRAKKISKLVERINLLYKNRDLKSVRQFLKSNPPSLVINALEILGDLNTILFFLVSAKKVKMTNLLLSFNTDIKEKIFKETHVLILWDLLKELNSDDIVSLLKEVPRELYRKIIINAPDDLKPGIRKIEDFEYTEIGSIMNTTFFTIREDLTINEAILQLESLKDDFEIEKEIYVSDSEEKIIGKIKIQDLLLRKYQNNYIHEIIDKNFQTFLPSEKIKKVIELFKKYQIESIAIVDQEEKIIGIVNNKDIIPEIVIENFENVYKLYGITEIEDSYLNSTVLDIVKSRIFWLLMMLLIATLTTFTIDKFESIGVLWTAGISSVILIPIIPVINDVCGNAGSQTTATMIQKISFGEIKETHFFEILKKEFKVSVVIGSILGFFNFLRLFFYFWVFPIDSKKIHLKTNFFMDLASSPILNWISFNQAQINSDDLFKVSIVGAASSSVALMLSVILSKCFGVLIPFLSIKLNYNPASFSTPALTTILDTLSAVIFFCICIFPIYLAIEPILCMKVSHGKLQQQNTMTYLFGLTKENFNFLGYLS